MIRVAILGLGFMGQMHARVYQELGGVEVVGIADTFPDVARLASEIGLDAAISGSLAELLKTTDFDVVDICLPTDLHASSITEAARAGKHVFCEKPLGLEIAEAEKALGEVEKAGIFLQVGQCIRFWPEYQALEGFVRVERAGKLRSLSMKRCAGCPSYSRNNWLHESGRSKGAALDLHIHDTDFVLHLLGKPKAVHSIGTWQKDAWSHLFTHYVYDNIAVSAEGGWNLPLEWGFQMAFQAIFDEAVIDFDSMKVPTLMIAAGQAKREPLSFEACKMRGAGQSTGNVSEFGGYYNELAYFIDCLRQGKKPEIATGRQALESLRVVLAEIESAASGAPVNL